MWVKNRHFKFYTWDSVVPVQQLSLTIDRDVHVYSTFMGFSWSSFCLNPFQSARFRQRTCKQIGSMAYQLRIHKIPNLEQALVTMVSFATWRASAILVWKTFLQIDLCDKYLLENCRKYLEGNNLVLQFAVISETHFRCEISSVVVFLNFLTRHDEKVGNFR